MSKAVEIYDEIEEEWTGRKVLEVYQYGEGEAGDYANNLRGQVCKIYDGAGVVEIPAYDFKGNPLSQVRTYTEDATQHPDWTTIGSVSLEPESYNTDNRYDALSRPVNRTSPEGGKTSYTYDKGGLLQTVTVQHIHSLDTGVVNNIEYDAKGQRTKIQYENGTTTTYEYDTFTFRVRRIRTTRHSDSAELQDLQYWYDPVGNITLQKDAAQQDVYFDGSVAGPHNDYTYDALYRLIRAAGREHAGNNSAPGYNDYDSGRTGINPVPVDSADTAKMRRYRQYYEYDATGNLVKMKHRVAGGTGNWTRHYSTANTSNRLQSTVVGSGTPEAYMYDERGNIISGFIHLQRMVYNAENRLETVVLTAGRTAYYQYDSNGQRVRKTITDTDTELTEMRKYVGEWEIYLKFDSDTLATDTERETLHVSDDTGRIVQVDTLLDEWGGVEEQLQRYQYSNHLQSATLELDESGAVISYEEYYAYGSTSLQAGRSGAEVSLKRYRYTGKERDEETGLYYHGARYYIPWLCRWTATDPINSENYNLAKGYGLEKNRERDFLELCASPYEYAGNSPTYYIDKSGEFKLKYDEKQLKSLGITKPEATRFENIVSNIYKLVENNPQALNAIANTTGFSIDKIKLDFQMGDGPTIDIKDIGGGAIGNKSGITVDPTMVKYLAGINGGDKLKLSEQVLGMALTILHEYGHYGDQTTNSGMNTGQFLYAKRGDFFTGFFEGMIKDSERLGGNNADMGTQEWRITLSGHRGLDIEIMGFGISSAVDDEGKNTIYKGELSPLTPKDYHDKIPTSLPKEAQGENILKTLNVK